MTISYFAYGSNMTEENLRQRVPSANRIGAARLDGYRIAFTRRSARTQSGVADIVADPDFSVWGVVFELEDAELPGLARKEGLNLNPPAYRRRDVMVQLRGSSAPTKALTYTVATPSDHEIVPSLRYLNSMIDAISAAKINKYADFLRWLQNECIDAQRSKPGEILNRPGLLVCRTTAVPRGSAPVIRLSPVHAVASSRYVAVQFGHQTAIGYAIPDRTIGDDRCALDQALRSALGIEGQMVYGHTVTVRRLSGRLVSGIRTRTLTLKLSQTRIEDAEKQLCVVHPRNLELLGVQSGEFVSLHRPEAAEAAFLDRRITLRCIAAEIEGAAGYPDLARIYLDKACRARLGITGHASEYLGIPILVRPSVLKAIQSRVVAYGITVLLGASTFVELAGRLFPHAGNIGVAVIGLGVAIGLTFVLAFLDLRAKLRN